MTTRTRHTLSPQRSILLGVLLCAWLLAQGLGLAHRTLHAWVPTPQSPTAAALAMAAGIGEAKVGAHHGLFGGHARGADCLLYDHAGAADVLVGIAIGAAVANWAPPRPVPVRAGVSVRIALPFHARAPPPLR